MAPAQNHFAQLARDDVGPFWGLSRDYMRKHLGIGFKIDNTRSIEELGITYQPLEETLIDHYRSWSERSVTGAARPWTRLRRDGHDRYSVLCLRIAPMAPRVGRNP
jgi:hypothetical protein